MLKAKRAAHWIDPIQNDLDSETEFSAGLRTDEMIMKFQLQIALYSLCWNVKNCIQLLKSVFTLRVRRNRLCGQSLI